MRVKVIRFITVFVIAICLELFIFNYSYFVSNFDTSKEYNQKFTLEDMIVQNWSETPEGLVSLPDPNLILENVNCTIDNLQITFEANKPISDIIVFYTTKENPFFNGELLKSTTDVNAEGTIFSIKENQVKDLRIDLSDAPDILLKYIEIIINPVTMNFSISRIVAVLLIYIFAIKLFSLQESPKYNVEDNEKGE